MTESPEKHLRSWEALPSSPVCLVRLVIEGFLVIVIVSSAFFGYVFSFSLSLVVSRFNSFCHFDYGCVRVIFSSTRQEI